MGGGKAKEGREREREGKGSWGSIQGNIERRGKGV